MEPTDEVLDREKECALHQRLLAGDATASADLALLLWERLLKRVRDKNRRVDDQICGDAASEAFANYVKNPTSFDSGHKSLFGYLCMAADGALALAELREELVLAEPILAEVRRGLSEAELAALELFLAGERKTEAYAEALGVQGRPFAEQQDIVKRFKDKIAGRFKLARRDHEFS